MVVSGVPYSHVGNVKLPKHSIVSYLFEPHGLSTASPGIRVARSRLAR